MLQKTNTLFQQNNISRKITCHSWIAEGTIKNLEQMVLKLFFFVVSDFFFHLLPFFIWREEICNIIFKNVIVLRETTHITSAWWKKKKKKIL